MSPEQLVRSFFDVVRSGAEPDRAAQFLAPRVLAHQVQSEDPVTVERTPEQYADHVREMLAEFGRFTLTVDEVIAGADRVFVRWTQVGRDSATGRPVTQMSSCVYRVEGGLVAEYWIQIDRFGLAAQRAAG